MMLTIMLPLHATLIPQYALFHKLGWVNTFLPLTVPKFLAVDSFLHLSDDPIYPRHSAGTG